jgi:hypothetical protein
MFSIRKSKQTHVKGSVFLLFMITACWVLGVNCALRVDSISSLLLQPESCTALSTLSALFESCADELGEGRQHEAAQGSSQS